MIGAVFSKYSKLIGSIWGFRLLAYWCESMLTARDIQAWEYLPLGPFLGKNFGK